MPWTLGLTVGYSSGRLKSVGYRGLGCHAGCASRSNLGVWGVIWVLTVYRWEDQADLLCYALWDMDGLRGWLQHEKKDTGRSPEVVGSSGRVEQTRSGPLMLG